MTGPLRHVAIAAPRNGTTAHVVDPSSGTVVAGALFTPTAGRFLVVVVVGAVTTTTPAGWTLPANGSAINEVGAYVFHRTAAGGDTISVTHNGSNYPVVFHFFEYESGSIFLGSNATANVANGGAGPTLSGLTGTNWIGFVSGQANHDTTADSTTWATGTELVDSSVIFATTDGYTYSLAYLEDSALSSASGAATSSQSANLERLVFAVNAAAEIPLDPGNGKILLEDGSGAYEIEGTTDDYLLDSAASGGVDQALSGTVAASTTTTGTMAARLGLVGAVAATSALVGAINVDHPLGGTVAATSATSGSIAINKPLSGSTAATSATTGSPTLRASLGGSTAATTSTAGAITADHPLSGASAATSATTGTIAAQLALAGTAAATSATTGNPTSNQALTGTPVVATTGTSGSIRSTGALSGTVASTTATSGTIASRQGLSGTTASVSGGYGTLYEPGVTTHPLSGTTSATSGTTGTIRAQLRLSGQVAATATTAGAFTRSAALAAQVVATGGAAGTITVRVSLAGAVDATSTTTGSPTVRVALSGVVAAVSGTSLRFENTAVIHLTAGAALPSRYTASLVLPSRYTASLAPVRHTSGSPQPNRYSAGGLMPKQLFADDPDANAVFPITDSNGSDLTWSPVVIVGSQSVNATWLGDPASTRDLRIPLDGLNPGKYRLRLVVPGDNDIRLDDVELT